MLLCLRYHLTMYMHKVSAGKIEIIIEHKYYWLALSLSIDERLYALLSLHSFPVE